MESCPAKAYALANEYGPFRYFGLEVNPWLRECHQEGINLQQFEDKWKAIVELDSRFVDGYAGEKLYRGIHMPLGWHPSDTYCEAGYLSASTAIAHAMSFSKGPDLKVLFKIDYKENSHIDLRDVGASEAEILLPRGLVFKVSDWQPDACEEMQIGMSQYGPPDRLLTLTLGD